MSYHVVLNAVTYPMVSYVSDVCQHVPCYGVECVRYTPSFILWCPMFQMYANVSYVMVLSVSDIHQVLTDSVLCFRCTPTCPVMVLNVSNTHQVLTDGVVCFRRTLACPMLWCWMCQIYTKSWLMESFVSDVHQHVLLWCWMCQIYTKSYLMVSYVSDVHQHVLCYGVECVRYTPSLDWWCPMFQMYADMSYVMVLNVSDNTPSLDWWCPVFQMYTMSCDGVECVRYTWSP